MARMISPGRWQANIRDASGKRHRPSFATEQEAVDWEKRAADAIRLGLDLPAKEGVNNAPTLSYVAETYKKEIWKGDLTTVNKNLSRVYEFFGRGMPVNKIGNRSIIDFTIWMRDDMGLSASTINSKLATASKLLKFCVKVEFIDKLPVIERAQKNTSQPRFLTKDEVSQVLGILKHWGLVDTYEYTRLLLYVGCRFSEPLQVQAEDITSAGIFFRKTKAKKPRTVPLTSQAREACEHFLHRRHNSGVFSSMNYQGYREHWARLREHMGRSEDPTFTPHILRHTCASRLVQAGVDLMRVKEWMGHKSIQTTLIYANLTAKDLDPAARLLEEF